jgi:hypothetical protein
MMTTKRARTSDDTDRATLVPELETNALATTAVTMFLSVIAAAAQSAKLHLFDDDRGSVSPQNVPYQAVDQIPTQASDDASGSTSLQRLGDSAADGISSGAQVDHAESRPDAIPAIVQYDHDGTAPETATAFSSPLIAGQTPSNQPQSTRSNHIGDLTGCGDPGAAVASGSVTDQPIGSVFHSTLGNAPKVLDSTSVHISQALDYTLGNISHMIVSQVSSVVADLTSSIQVPTLALSGLSDPTDVTHLGMVSDAIGGVVQATLAAPAAAASLVVSTVFGTASATFNATSLTHDTPVLDTSGLIPVGLLHSAVPVGFVGQAHADTPDQHDGAFSALGLHVF